MSILDVAIYIRINFNFSVYSMQYITRLIADLQQQVVSLLHRIQQLEIIVHAKNHIPRSPQIRIGTPVKPRRIVYISDADLSDIHENTIHDD